MSSSRPGWMEGGAKRPKPTRAPAAPATSAAPVLTPTERPAEPRIVVNVPDHPTTHRNVVVGVTLMAILFLFSTFFWIGIGIAAAISPPEAAFMLSGGLELVTLGDYLSPPRLAVGFFAGLFGTAGAWMIVDNMISC